VTEPEPGVLPALESPSAAVRAHERDTERIDPSDIVDWFIKEFPRRR
jgi:hypothetical protein